MVEELRVLSRAREARLAAEMSEFDATELVTDVVTELREAAERGGLELTLESPGEPVTICADLAGLRQVIDNLVSNAIRYTPPGGRVEVTLARTADSLRLEVRDTGIGIPAADLPHVFEEFYRAPNARAHTTGGTGLGLAIVGAVVRQHGGTVNVESAPDEGTRVTVALPIPSRACPNL
jgi:signal transduction histidine kinase